MNNQIKRGMNRIEDALSQVERNQQQLKTNADTVSCTSVDIVYKAGGEGQGYFGENDCWGKAGENRCICGQFGEQLERGMRHQNSDSHELFSHTSP